MRLYDNVTDSNYETLKTLYPVWYRDVLEMDAIWKAFGPQLDGMQKGLTQAVDNGFIWTADEPTITELEKFLYIPVARSKAMIERKTLVASFSIGNGHIGEQEIKAVISIFTDGEIEVALVGGTIEVSVTREISDRFNLADCMYILLKKIPAHLRLAFRDILRPILFENENALLFRSFEVHGRFSNRGQMEPILLTGRRLLDGSWLLNQEYSGIAFRAFEAAASFLTRERVGIPLYTFAMKLAPTVPALGLGALCFRAQFFNNSETERIMLDGQRVLDGSWLLNQELRGLVFPAFGAAMSVSTPERVNSSRITFSTGALLNAYLNRLESFGVAQDVQNAHAVKHESAQFDLRAQTTPGELKTPRMEFSPEPMLNATLGRLRSFGVVQDVQNAHAVKYKDLRLALRGVRQSYALSGSVILDSMYELNGTVLLDGSRKLNANIIKEEI